MSDDDDDDEDREDADFCQPPPCANKPDPEKKAPVDLRLRYQGNNKGGYGNPPVKSQFKRGGKGGPGRKKGVSNLESAMRKATSKKLVVNRNGRKERMMPVEIYAERAVEAVLAKSPSPRMLEIGQQLFEKWGPKDPEDDTNLIVHDFTLEELDVLVALLNRSTGSAAAMDERSVFGPEYAHKLAGTYKVDRRADGHITIRKIGEIEQ